MNPKTTFPLRIDWDDNEKPCLIDAITICKLFMAYEPSWDTLVSKWFKDAKSRGNIKFGKYYPKFVYKGDGSKKREKVHIS